MFIALRVSRNPSNFKPSPLLALELEPVRNHGDEFTIRGLSLGVGDGVAEVLLEEKSFIFIQKTVTFQIILRNTPKANFGGGYRVVYWLEPYSLWACSHSIIA